MAGMGAWAGTLPAGDAVFMSKSSHVIEVVKVRAAAVQPDKVLAWYK